MNDPFLTQFVQGSIEKHLVMYAVRPAYFIKQKQPMYTRIFKSSYVISLQNEVSTKFLFAHQKPVLWCPLQEVN